MKFREVPYYSQLLLVFLLYISAALISQHFSINPGNISPIWLPSGLMVSMVFLLGYRIWPAIFFGAIVGNISQYIDLSSITGFMTCLSSALLNGLGDAIGIVGSVYLYFRFQSKSEHVLSNLSGFSVFLLFCVVLGSFVSAIFGVTGLWFNGFIESENYFISLITWFVGDGVGVLVITPLLLSFFVERGSYFSNRSFIECAVFVTCWLFLLSWKVFSSQPSEILPPVIFFSLPLIVWSIIRFGFKMTLSLMVINACISTLDFVLSQSSFNASANLEALINLQLHLALLTTSVCLFGVVASERSYLIRSLSEQLEHDPLTGSFTRRYINQRINDEFERTERHGLPFGLIMFDIDDFKKINDKYGHQVGDQVLIKVTEVIQKELRSIDVLARWGGEEFMLLVPDTNLSGTEKLAERLRHVIESYNFGIDERITISLGVCVVSMKVSIEDMLINLDQAMYKSKRDGKNKVSVIGPETSYLQCAT